MLNRVSVANLVYDVVVEGSEARHSIAILSPSAWKKGIQRFQALGGGALLTPKGREQLVGMGAKSFEEDDARFLIEGTRVKKVFAFFEKRNCNFFETHPRREVVEELSVEKLSKLPPVLSFEEASRIKSRYVGTVLQPVPEKNQGTSDRELSGIPTRRLFMIHDLVVTQDIFAKLVASEAIHFLSQRELQSTKGGTQKGYTDQEGGLLADNLGILVPKRT